MRENIWGVNERSQIEGAQIDGARIEGSQIKGSQIKGSQIEGLQTEGLPTEGVQAEGTRTESKDAYLDTLTDQIRYKKARAAVRREVGAHLEDQIGEYLMQGMTREEAEREAVRQMGDPVEVGVSMDRIHRPRMPWGMILWISALGLLGIGIQAALQARFPSLYFLPGGWEKQLLILILGLAVMTAVCFVDYSRIGRYARELTVVLWIFLYIGLWISGRQVNGAIRWIVFPGGVSVHIGLLSQLLVPLYAGILYHYRGLGYAALVKAAAWTVPGVWLLLISPDISNAALLVFSFSVLVSIAVWKGWYRVRRKRVLAVWWGTLLMVPAAVILRFVGRESYQGDRIRALLGIGGSEPGYRTQITRSLVSASQILGNSGINENTVTAMGDESGNVLTYGIACYGIAAAALLVGAIALLLLRFLRISLRQKNQLGLLMGAGCCAVFLWELTLYVCANTGVLALDLSMFCPFLTYGGTGTLASFFLLGLLLSVCRCQSIDLEAARTEKSQPGRRTA